MVTMTISKSEMYYKYVHFPVSAGTILDKSLSPFPWIPKVTYWLPLLFLTLKATLLKAAKG